MISRRELAVGMAGAAVAAGAARAADPPAADETAKALSDATNQAWTSWRAEGRYLPAWPRIMSLIGSASGGAERQWAALLGDEATALVGASESRLAADVSAARTEDAIAAIVARAKDRRVVILNEAHVASRHRLFLGRVMQALYHEGFTHLACETFSNGPAAGGFRVETLTAGASLRPTHGYYVADPVFAETVREALGLGYQLAGYEQVLTKDDVNQPMDERVRRREKAEAENLAKALAAAPDGRFLVYVGYDHLAKPPQPKVGPWMAGCLKEMTGLDPLTIQQDGTGSFAPHAPDNAAAQAVFAKFAPKDSVAVFGADGAALGGARRACDLTVFHPPVTDVEGRPGWLAAAQGRKRVAVRLPKPAPGAYVLAQALYASDSDPAIPADQYLLAQGAREAIFHLRPGRYRVRLETPEGFTAVGEARA